MSLKFLEHHLPLWDGQRHTKPRLNVRDINMTKDPGLYRPSQPQLARMESSKLERHMSEGELAGGQLALVAVCVVECEGGDCMVRGGLVGL